MKKVKTLFFKFIKLIFGNLRNAFISLGLIICAVLFIFIRMRGVEQDYALNKLNDKHSQINLKNKELKAERAILMSPNNLKQIATQYKLNQPGPHQIIVIPE